MAKKKEPSLEGKEVAIVGLGGSFSEYILARINSKKFDEVWGINSIGAILHVDRTFMMDPASRFLDGKKAGTQTGIGREHLLETPKKGPIYTCTLDERVPELELFPLEEVVSDLRFCYFNNTVAYAVAFAIWKKVKKISFYGVDFSYSKNINFAEAGRGCVEFWCAVAVTKGIEVEVARTSGLLDTNVPEQEKLYGYHRLDDPLVQKFDAGGLIIGPQSSFTAPPEPEDGDGTAGVLIGRHDIPGISYKEEDDG